MGLWVQLDMPELGVPDHLFGGFLRFRIQFSRNRYLHGVFSILLLFRIDTCTQVLGYQAYQVRNLGPLKHLVRIATVGRLALINFLHIPSQ